MKSTVIIILLLLITETVIPQEKLSLSEAINIGLENNYSLRISRKNVEISNENDSWGTAGRYPTIDINVSSINRIDHSNQTNSDVTTNNIAPSAKLTWVLFNGFRIFNTKSKLEEQYKLSKGFNSLSLENTVKSIIISYYDVLLQKEKLKVFKELEKLSYDRYQRAKTSNEIGSSVTFQVLQAKTAWLEDRSSRLRQKLNYDNSIRKLNLLIGEKTDKYYDDFDEFKTKINNYKLIDLEDKMMSNNRNIKNQFINEIIAEKNINIAKGGFYPSLIFSSGYDYLNSRKEISGFPRTTSNSYDYYGNLTLSLNLFDGLNTRRSLEIAKIQKEINKIETEEIIHTLKNNLAQLIDLYNIQKDLLSVSEENIEAAKLNFKISKDKFRNGTINSFNYRDAQIAYLNASIQKLNSIYNLIITDTELAQITGAILTEN
jgi:outer membrane protein TolC